MVLPDWTVVGLTLKLALVVTLWLLVLSIPIAWWLSQTRSKWKGAVASVLTLPMVLPPTVLGFYLLLLFSPNSHLGRGLKALGIDALPFSFAGLVVACVIHSFPFVVQPLRNTFEALGKAPFEAAATLRCSPFHVFWEVALPLAWPGIFSAAIIGFCHTLGEFGVVLMIGGNMPGKTRVMSVEIYNLVEAMEYQQAHAMSLLLLVFSFAALMGVHGLNHFHQRRGQHD